jgi:hypothetical protein
MTEPTGFTIEQAIGAQRALRAALGLGDEIFPLPAFVGMISDEIEQMREAGHSDAGVIRIIADATGRTITGDDLARYYAPPDRRRRA